MPYSSGWADQLGHNILRCMEKILLLSKPCVHSLLFSAPCMCWCSPTLLDPAGRGWYSLSQRGKMGAGDAVGGVATLWGRGTDRMVSGHPFQGPLSGILWLCKVKWWNENRKCRIYSQYSMSTTLQIVFLCGKWLSDSSALFSLKSPAERV